MELKPLSGYPLSLNNWLLVKVLARVGEDDAAVDELQKMLSVPYWFSASFFRVNPYMDPLCGNPRFQELVQERKP